MKRLVTPPADRVPRYLLAFSLGLALLLMGEAVNLLRFRGEFWTLTPEGLPWEFLIGALTTLPFVLGIGYGAYYLGSEPFPRERYPRVFRWFLAGLVVFLGINLLTMLSFDTSNVWVIVGWMRWAIALGGGAGLLIGLTEARAITNALEAEAERLRAEQVVSQRDTLDYLNSLLRHEVLNSINVIEGHGELLEEYVDRTDPEHVHVETIVRRSHDIESIVTDVRRLMETMEGGQEPEPVDLDELLSAEVQKVRDMETDIDIEVDVPDDVVVDGDSTLARVFGNLLANAVEHNDSDTARISVTATRQGDYIGVHVSDNGPGIDPDERETLFERPDVGPVDHGFGLYIVDRLCERYGGDIELTETGPEGTTFTVTLPCSDAASTSGSPSSVAAEAAD